MNPGTRSRPQYEGMVGLGAQRTTICRIARHVQSILDLFAELGYNPRGRPPIRVRRRPRTPPVSGSGGGPDVGRCRHGPAPDRVRGRHLLAVGTHAARRRDGAVARRRATTRPACSSSTCDASATCSTRVAPASAPIRALHLGGGAMSLPRYVAATRPGSTQVVVEIRRRARRDGARAPAAAPSAPTSRSLVADARSALGADGALAGAAPFDVGRSSTSTRASRHRRSSTTPHSWADASRPSPRAASSW